MYLEFSISKELLETFLIDFSGIISNPLHTKKMNNYHCLSLELLLIPVTCLRLKGLSVSVVTSNSTGGGSNTLPITNLITNLA